MLVATATAVMIRRLMAANFCGSLICRRRCRMSRKPRRSITPLFLVVFDRLARETLYRLTMHDCNIVMTKDAKSIHLVALTGMSTDICGTTRCAAATRIFRHTVPRRTLPGSIIVSGQDVATASAMPPIALTATTTSGGAFHIGQHAGFACLPQREFLLFAPAVC